MRETDNDWNIIAEHNPFFGVLANAEYLGKDLPPEKKARFYESGRVDIAFTLDVARRHFGVVPRFGRALDFGCGVGRLTKAMAEHADAVTGVDISEHMIEVARRNVSGEHVEFRPALPEGPFNWINSHMVFQHIPPGRGIGILRDLLDLAAPGCFVTIQLPFYRDRSFFQQTMEKIDAVAFDGSRIDVIARSQHSEGTMLMFDYPWPQVYAAFVDRGFSNIHMIHTNHGGVHGAWMFSTRD